MKFSVRNERTAQYANQGRVLINTSFDKILEMIDGEDCQVHWDRDYNGEQISENGDGIPIGIWDPVVTRNGIGLGCVVINICHTPYHYIRWAYYVKDDNGVWLRES